MNNWGKDKGKAEKAYKKLVKSWRGKTYLDILPPEFSNYSRSIIKGGILRKIDKVTDLLNNSTLYEGRVFDKKEVAMYMMLGYDDFHLSNMIIPRKDIFSFAEDEYTALYKDESLVKDDRDKGRDKIREKYKKEIDEMDLLSRELDWCRDTYDTYTSRQKVKRGELVHSFDMEKDGWPSDSRGAVCYLFIPVKGEFPTGEQSVISLLNPRNKKVYDYKVLGYKKEGGGTYMCENEKGNKVFLIPHETVEHAYDALFSVNKEIYSGWWNKTMIINNKNK